VVLAGSEDLVDSGRHRYEASWKSGGKEFVSWDNCSPREEDGLPRCSFDGYKKAKKQVDRKDLVLVGIRSKTILKMTLISSPTARLWWGIYNDFDVGPKGPLNVWLAAERFETDQDVGDGGSLVDWERTPTTKIHIAGVPELFPAY
jgi:hypothetical protein